MRAVDTAISSSLALVAGGCLALLTDRTLRHVRAPDGTKYAGLGLLGVAFVYPAARTDPWVIGGPQQREWSAVAATAILAGAAWIFPKPARNVVAIGWAAHAAFDLLHAGNAGTRLPRWYPALCAGFDLVLAERLIK